MGFVPASFRYYIKDDEKNCWIIDRALNENQFYVSCLNQIRVVTIDEDTIIHKKLCQGESTEKVYKKLNSYKFFDLFHSIIIIGVVFVSIMTCIYFTDLIPFIIIVGVFIIFILFMFLVGLQNYRYCLKNNITKNLSEEDDSDSQ